MILLRGLVTRWLTDDPQPGLVEIQFDDVDGRAHRFVEKSAVIDSVGAVHPGADYPIAIGIACRPHDQRYRPDKDDPINSVDLSPWGVGDEGALYSVDREALAWAPPATYSDLSVVARQAVALVTFRRWRATVGLVAPELDALEQHLWRFATVVPETFDAWYEADGLMTLEPSDPLPARLRGAIESAGSDPGHVRSAIDALVEITYGGLFGGIQSGSSLEQLNTVVEFAARQGITPAPADPFIDSLWIDDDWGRPSATLVSQWRDVD
ncbi:hypothetical protein C8N24_6508 [Solirubrobacter pauli]|uniref:Uncharacterized protein n=1 Tax=Solirubrobacter pauli TaxID=166793 RepID=A0A660KUZ9_9ACTN|nr:hypothetical protein [Solirubrobacter pauli]RKQ84878.1 hypothetical protein C8N24_6508 [Solirubrobacter pauli]